jgi:RNA binding exosome subunit
MSNLPEITPHKIKSHPMPRQILGVEKDPLNRSLEEVFKKQIIRVNPRVKISLYSPTKISHGSLVPRKLRSIFKNSNRYKSVDESAKRNVNARTVETSISKFQNSSVQNDRNWYIKERPDEMLKRYLRLNKHNLSKVNETINEGKKLIKSGAFEVNNSESHQKWEDQQKVNEHVNDSSKLYIENLKQKMALRNHIKKDVKKIMIKR